MPFKDHDLNLALKNLRQMENEVERLLKDFFVSKNPILMVSENGWTPNIDVYETADSFIIKGELAGVKKEEVKIQMNDRIVLISGKRDDECEEVREHFHMAEVSYGAFVRKIELPGDIDSENVKAKYKYGYLMIYVPKAQEIVKGAFSIPISD
jgi:HSP20 family protein